MEASLLRACLFVQGEFLILDRDARERFVIEAQAAAARSHPNICTNL
jgi:hypothetical protein